MRLSHGRAPKGQGRHAEAGDAYCRRCCSTRPWRQSSRGRSALGKAERYRRSPTVTSGPNTLSWGAKQFLKARDEHKRKRFKRLHGAAAGSVNPCLAAEGSVSLLVATIPIPGSSANNPQTGQMERRVARKAFRSQATRDGHAACLFVGTGNDGQAFRACRPEILPVRGLTAPPRRRRRGLGAAGSTSTAPPTDQCPPRIARILVYLIMRAVLTRLYIARGRIAVGSGTLVFSAKALLTTRAVG